MFDADAARRLVRRTGAIPQVPQDAVNRCVTEIWQAARDGQYQAFVEPSGCDEPGATELRRRGFEVELIDTNGARFWHIRWRQPEAVPA